MIHWLLCAPIVVIATVWVLRQLKRKPGASFHVPPDTVCLFQVGRGPKVPSISPFPLKVETFLRMAHIPYVNDHSGQFSRKGKTPWISYNDVHVADSQLSIDFLKKTLTLDVDKGLDVKDKSVAWAFRELTEENLYWTMCYETFVKSPESLDILLKDIFPRWKIFMFKMVMGWRIKKQLWGHGMGRHSDEEIWSIAQKDLNALSTFLGTKSFLMGDTPHEVDCAVFGMLAMIVWQMAGSRHERLVYEELPNLVAYCERMQSRFWPDWEQRCKGHNYTNDHGKAYRTLINATSE